MYTSDPRAASIVLTNYYKISDARGWFDLISRYSAIVALILFAHFANNWLASLFAIVMIGAVQHALANLQHEAWHYLCFKSKKLNDFIASYFYSYTMGGFFFYNQVRHRGHHAYFSTMKDPDRETYVNVGKSTPWEYVRYFTFMLFGGLIIDRVIRVFGKKMGELPGLDMTVPNTPDTRKEMISIALTQLVLMGIFLASGHYWYYWIYWFLPLVTVASFLSSWRQFMEHAYPESDDAQPKERLFEFDANLIERFFVAPIHFQYHAFHHAFPKIPHYRLKEAKKAARADNIDYTHIQRKGYVAVSLEHLRRLKEATRSVGKEQTGASQGV